MKYKIHIINAAFAAILGGVMGTVITYLVSQTQALPGTMGEFKMDQGIAGLISGIMGGLMGVIIPYIIIPILSKKSPKN